MEIIARIIETNLGGQFTQNIFVFHKFTQFLVGADTFLNTSNYKVRIINQNDELDDLSQGDQLSKSQTQNLITI